MPIPTEEIPSEDPIGRLIYFPAMYRGLEQIIVNLVFQFPEDQGRCECVVWSKYAPIPDGMNEIGVKDEEVKKARRPEARYMGFIVAVAGQIRQLTIANGHGFSLAHKPDEGDYHAVITFRAAANLNITKAERSELKVVLFNAFSPMVPFERAIA